MERHRGESAVGELDGEVVGTTLGCRKDDRLVHIGIAQQVIEQAQLVTGVVRVQQTLGNVCMAIIARDQLDAARLTHHARGQTGDGTVQRGREEQGLARLRRAVDDHVDVVDEPHVEHAVGFVQDEGVHGREIDAACLQVIEQTARRGDQYVDAA